MMCKYLSRISLIAICLAFVVGCAGLNQQEIQATAEAQARNLIARAGTLLPTVTPTMISTPTSLPVEIMDSRGLAMMLVPGGESKMVDYYEKTSYTVTLSDFYMDEYEVSNAAYERCVDAGKCAPPSQSGSETRSTYYSNPEFADYPVIYVDWNMAKAYCEWRDARLPTEAEWEKSACGPEGCNHFGDEPIYCSIANYGGCIGDTTPVGSYEKDKSDYGIYDMAGNVEEWVNDWFEYDYFALLATYTSNPQGPSTGNFRVVRGGSWISSFNLRDSRMPSDPLDANQYYGFRCARSP